MWVRVFETTLVLTVEGSGCSSFETRHKSQLSPHGKAGQHTDDQSKTLILFPTSFYDAWRVRTSVEHGAELGNLFQNPSDDLSKNT